MFAEEPANRGDIPIHRKTGWACRAQPYGRLGVAEPAPRVRFGMTVARKKVPPTPVKGGGKVDQSPFGQVVSQCTPWGPGSKSRSSRGSSVDPGRLDVRWSTMVYKLLARKPNSNGVQSTSDGLPPSRNGLQPTSKET